MKPWYKDWFCVACVVVTAPLALGCIFMVYFIVGLTVWRMVRG